MSRVLAGLLAGRTGVRNRGVGVGASGGVVVVLVVVGGLAAAAATLASRVDWWSSSSTTGYRLLSVGWGAVQCPASLAAPRVPRIHVWSLTAPHPLVTHHPSPTTRTDPHQFFSSPWPTRQPRVPSVNPPAHPAAETESRGPGLLSYLGVFRLCPVHSAVAFSYTVSNRGVTVHESTAKQRRCSGGPAATDGNGGVPVAGQIGARTTGVRTWRSGGTPTRPQTHNCLPRIRAAFENENTSILHKKKIQICAPAWPWTVPISIYRSPAHAEPAPKLPPWPDAPAPGPPVISSGKETDRAPGRVE